MKKKILSFVIPCYGSEKTLKPVVDEIHSVISQNKDFDYEIIAVNDCSPDNVWNVIKELASVDKNVKGIHLAKNANRPGAVMAGLFCSTGDIVIVMDDDGQCPMDKLWDLIQPIESGKYDVSMADYPERKQSLFKDFGTYVNKKMTEYIIDRPKNMQFTNFIALRRYVVDEILKYDNPYPYMTGLLLRTTQFICNVPMEERERIDGGTTFTLKKMIALWVNGLTAFSVKPLRLATALGIVSAIAGFIFGLVVVIRKIIVPDIAAGYSSIVAIVLFIGGLIMFMLGLIGEYIGRIYICMNNSPQYVIRDEINIDDDIN